MNPLNLPDDKFLNIKTLLDSTNTLLDNICAENKKVENYVKGWEDKPEGRILTLFKSQNPWNEIKEFEPDFLDKIIEWFKEVKSDML